VVFVRQGDSAVYHHFFTERCRHDVRQSCEGLERALGYHPAKRVKQQLFAYKGDTASDDDATWTE
jgi:hypothetical protein